MMHHTKFLKRCLAQPRLLLRAVVLGMLLTGCFAVMAGFGASMASAQSLTRQTSSPSSPSVRGNNKPAKSKNQNDPRNQGNSANQGTPASEASPTSQGTPTSEASPTGQGNQGKNVPVDNKNNTAGSANQAAGSNNSSNGGGVGGGGVPGVLGVPGGGAGRPGLPSTGSDPYANPLP